MKKNFLPWVALGLLLFGLQEAAFRAIFPLPEIRNFNRVNYSPLRSPLQTSSFVGTQRPAMNATFRWSSRPDGASFDAHLNLYGFRDRDWRVRASLRTERVMFVGDSIMEGFMSTDAETIPAGYARAMGRRARAVEAMNFGIGGTGIAQYLALINDAAPLFRPRRIVVVFYANDFPFTAASSSLAPFQPVREPQMPRLLAVLRRAWQHEVIPRRWHGPAHSLCPSRPGAVEPLV